MRIGIIGNGIVGRVTAKQFGTKVCANCDGGGCAIRDFTESQCRHCAGTGLQPWNELVIYDTDTSRSTHTLSEVLATELIFICLPAPAKPNGVCDTSILDAFFADAPIDCCYVLRSTVPIGYTESFGLPNLVHFPDFHTERLNDALTPDYLVYGYQPQEFLPPPACATKLAKLLSERFPTTSKYAMLSRESETVKLLRNAYSATRVAFWNEVHPLMTERVANVLRPMQVPGPDGMMGFGGACLPKDLQNLIQHLKYTPLLQATAEYARK